MDDLCKMSNITRSWHLDISVSPLCTSITFILYFTGDVVAVLYEAGTDTTPADSGFYTGFSGFRIGTQ